MARKGSRAGPPSGTVNGTGPGVAVAATAGTATWPGLPDSRLVSSNAAKIGQRRARPCGSVNGPSFSLAIERRTRGDSVHEFNVRRGPCCDLQKDVSDRSAYRPGQSG